MTLSLRACAHRPPIFLHAGWRNRGSWIWAGLRGHPQAMGFFEPLHEALATLSPAAGTDPYWREYAGLLRPDGPGVAGFRPEFAADHAFAGAGTPPPELEAYLRGLLAHAAARELVPVLKFCRSMGRVPWLQARFPEALHVVVLRRPDAQWESARRQMEVDGNPGSLAAPLLMLARNADAPLVAEACRALRVPLPRLRHGTMQRAAEACREAVRQLSRGDRHRVFMAHWIAAALSALAADTLLIDSDMLVWSPHYRREVDGAMALCGGLRLALDLDPRRGAVAPPPPDREEAAVQLAALDLLQEHRAALRPDGYVMAWNLLAAGLVRPVPALLSHAPEEAPERAPMSLPRPWFHTLWGRCGGLLGAR